MGALLHVADRGGPNLGSFINHDAILGGGSYPNDHFIFNMHYSIKVSTVHEGERGQQSQKSVHVVYGCPLRGKKECHFSNEIITLCHK